LAVPNYVTAKAVRGDGTPLDGREDHGLAKLAGVSGAFPEKSLTLHLPLREQRRLPERSAVESRRPAPAKFSRQIMSEGSRNVVRFGRSDITASDFSGLAVSMRHAQLRLDALAMANRRRDEFLAMLSHELRSPLAAIRAAIHVLGSVTADDLIRHAMQALIERQIGRMSRLVDEVSDVSRISRGRLDLQLERVDLRMVVANAIETVGADIVERKHRLTTALPDSPVWVQADRGRLEQVFVNLLANASKYTDVGGELSVCVTMREGDAISVIRDSGIGIAPDVLPHIFDLFMQADDAIARSKSGLGVGLALVRVFVESHGGSVTAASAGPGRGSEFIVRLPGDNGSLITHPGHS
jgi:signal transduction histidine kinase